MAGEIQLNSTTMATESSGTITLSNVNSATNRTNLGLGSMATQNADAVALTGGSVTGTEIDLKSSGTTIYKSDGTTAVLSESGGVVTLNHVTLGSNCDSSFLRINDNFQIKRYFNSTSVPDSTWTTLVDVDDAIENYIHSYGFGGDRFIATTHVFGINPGSGIVSWGVEAQNNTGFADKIVWHSASGYDISFRTVYNSSTSIGLQIYNSTGYGPHLFQTITEFWYYTY